MNNSWESETAIWKEIEISESYLVCSMYEEAESLSSSILKQLRNHHSTTQDMFQSTSMVLVQAFNQLAKTPEILNQLREYFISLKAIPAQVLLTGACLQIGQGSTLGVREFLEEFLNGWSLGDGQYHAVIVEQNEERESRLERHFVLGIDEYLELVEVYAITLLATVLKEVDLAVSWVENAQLPEENRQELLRRLRSIHSLRSTTSSQVASLQSPTNNNETYSSKELHEYKGSHGALTSKHAVVSKLSERIETCSWCFRAINFKLANAKFVVPSGKIMLGCLILFACYVLRRKQATLKRIVRRQVIVTKKALVDLWELAFSHQVNPLAAVQPLTTATLQGQ